MESVNVSCLITTIPNQLIIKAMEQISIIFANTALIHETNLLFWYLSLGWFKSAKNFICQKMQFFWPDSDYMGKINIEKIFIEIFFSKFSFA